MQTRDFVIERGARDELITSHETFVRRVVLRTVRTLGLPNESIDDYIAAGFLGLVEAAERFDGSCGVPFERYAFLRIRGAVIDYIREHSELTGRAYRYAKALFAIRDIEEETSMLVRHEKNPAKALAKIFSFAAQGAISYRLCSKESQRALEGIPDESQNPERVLSRTEQYDGIKKLVSELPEKERYIIEGYYFRGQSFVDLTRERPELSKSWVSRLHARALEKLGRMIQEKRREDL